MKKVTVRAVCVLVCIIMSFLTVGDGLSFAVLGDEASLKKEISQLQAESEKLKKEIANLKKDAGKKKELLTAIQKKVANAQAQISACNRQINSINSKIAANNKEIEKCNAQIAEEQLAFKKRIRAISMSDFDSSAKILMGADSFANFLQLSQLTDSVSSHDKMMIEDIVEIVDELNEKNAENEKLLKDQLSVKSTVTAQYKELAEDEAEAKKVYNDVYSDQKSAEAEKSKVDKTIKQKQAALAEFSSYLDNAGTFISTNTSLKWPVPFTRNISSGWGTRWGSFHYGIDISASNIYLKPVVAMADGVIYKATNDCKHKSLKPSCSCGSGFGNHVRINHGTMTLKVKTSDMKKIETKTVKIGAIYGHMDHIIVSEGQKVKQGQVLGYVGTTGSSTGYHLHLSILLGGTNTHSDAINPLRVLF